MRFAWVAILGVLEVVLFGPFDYVLGFFGWGKNLSQIALDEALQERRDARWKKGFLNDKKLEQNSRNPFLTQTKTKSMQWGRSSGKKKL
jgi:hypothetical protein